MRVLSSSLAVKLVVILVLAWSITVQAQRRGGSGGGDDSGGGDSGEGEADGEETSRDEFCRINALYYSPLWLHRWIGTYYNGTIDVSINLNRSTTSCDEQNGVFERSFDGVLALLDPRYSGTNEPTGVEPLPYNPFIAVLLGWPDSTTQGDLFATRDNGSVLRDKGFPHAVEFLFETLGMFFEIAGGRLASDPVTRDNSPTCAVQNVTDTDTGYAFDCLYDARGEESLVRDTSQFFMPLSACNGSTLYPLTVEGANNRTLRGEFDPEEADLRWEGDFLGMFLPDLLKGASVSSESWMSENSTLQGSFTARFRGRADEEHSFKMAVERGSDVSWEEDEDRLDEQTFCPEGSGVSARSGGMLAMLAVIAIHIIAT